MAKKHANSPNTLSSCWCPPTDVLTDGVGEPVACIASTFEFGASFFETELLPRFLGLKFDHTENEQTFLVEREEKLSQVDAAVLIDIHKVDPGQTTLRWDQVPIAVPGASSIQHSKIVLLVWERLVRLLVSSANITRSGYRRNREVYAALDFFDGIESVPRRPVEDAISLLELMLAWSRVPIPTQDRHLGTLLRVREKLTSWTAIPEDFRPREKPKVSFIATHPATDKHRPSSAIDQVAATWGARSASEVTVFTPFVGQPNEDDDRVVRRVAAIPRSRDCVGWLVVPRRPSEPSDSVVRIPLAQAFGDAWAKHFDARGGGRVLGIPQFVNGIDKVNRPFHSKLLSLRTADQELLMIGSSNFTPHGMGVDAFNVEANLLFETADGDGWGRIELPLLWDEWKAVDDVQWDEHFEPAEDSVDHAGMLPRFFAWACYSQMTGLLQVSLDRTATEPTDWSIHLRGDASDELALFRSPLGIQTDVLTYTVAEQGRSASLAALVVEWIDNLGQQRRAGLIVSIKSKDDLAPSHQFRAFGVDAMLDCLIHGRSLAEWQERQSNKASRGRSVPEAVDSLRAVDTSGYLLYQVRRFGRAMSGLCERLERVVLIPTAVSYRFVKDPLGPFSLAEALTRNERQNTTSFASMSDDHRLFLLAELLLSVSHSARRLLTRADPKTREWLQELLREVMTAIADKVRTLHDSLEEDHSENMRQYVSKVLEETSGLTGTRPAEVDYAC